MFDISLLEKSLCWKMYLSILSAVHIFCIISSQQHGQITSQLNMTSFDCDVIITFAGRRFVHSVEYEYITDLHKERNEKHSEMVYCQSMAITIFMMTSMFYEPNALLVLK